MVMAMGYGLKYHEVEKIFPLIFEYILWGYCHSGGKERINAKEEDI
jgi:hypothetical protein